MKIFRLYYLLIIIVFLFIVSPFSIHAKDCSLTVDYPGPFSVLFSPDHASADCSYPPDGSALDMKTIEYGELKIQNVPLLAALHGDKSKLKVTGEGKLNLTPEDLSTFGIGGDILNVPQDRDQLQPYRKIIEASGNYDFGLHIRDAIAEGVTTYPEFITWACSHNLCIDNHLNPSVFSSASQLTPLADQLQNQLRVAQEIINCNNDPDYSNSHQCNNNYPLGNSDSFTIATQVKTWLDPNDIINSWTQLGEEQKFLVFGLNLFCASPSFAVVIPQKEDCTDWIGCIQNFFSPNQPGYIKFMIPNTCNIEQGTAQENNRFTPLKDQTSSSLTNSSPTSQPLLTELINEIKQRNGGQLTCPQDTTSALSESLGASAAPVRNTSTISILGNFFSSSSQDEALLDKRYCIFVFSPPQVVAADKALGANPDSLARKLEPLKTKKDFMAQINSPQNLKSDGQGSTDNTQGDCLEYTNDPITKTPKCVKYEDNFVSYGNGGSPKFDQPGRYAYNTKGLPFMKVQPLNSPNHIKSMSTCLVPWLAQGAEAKGIHLAKILKTDSFANQSCPDPTTSQNDVSPGTCVQALFEPGLCPGGQDCLDYICAKATERNISCRLLIMIAANENGGLFTCYSNLNSQLHFGCEPDNKSGPFDIASKLNCTMNYLSKYWASSNHDINETLRLYGYGCNNPYEPNRPGCAEIPVEQLPWNMFGLDPVTSLNAVDNSSDLSAIKSTISGAIEFNNDPDFWWKAYCGRFPSLIERAGPEGIDPKEYSCSKINN